MSADNEVFEALSGLVVLITAASVEETGMEGGAEYEMSAIGGIALCRWDTTAAAASDGGFTFVVAPGMPKRIKCPTGNTLLNVIEASADSSATAVLVISKVLPA